jgi:hypothetical protein
MARSRSASSRICTPARVLGILQTCERILLTLDSCMAWLGRGPR